MADLRPTRLRYERVSVGVIGPQLGARRLESPNPCDVVRAGRDVHGRWHVLELDLGQPVRHGVIAGYRGAQ